MSSFQFDKKSFSTSVVSDSSTVLPLKSREKLNMTKSEGYKSVPKVSKISERKYLEKNKFSPFGTSALRFSHTRRSFRAYRQRENQPNRKPTIGDVMEWLQKNQCKIKILIDGRFILNNRIVSRDHIIIVANRMRVNQNLPPFILEGIAK